MNEILKLKIEIGKIDSDNSLKPIFGQRGINFKKFSDLFKEKAENFDSDMVVNVRVDINQAKKEFTIDIICPIASWVIKKEIGRERISEETISFEEILKIAKKYVKYTPFKERELALMYSGTIRSWGGLINY